MNCHYCFGPCIKKGKQKNGSQKFYCKHCEKYQQETYINKAWHPSTNDLIRKMTIRSCGVRAIGFILGISPTTVIRKTLRIAESITKPAVPLGKTYEVDELKSYCKYKTRERWVTYAIRSDTRQTVDFRIGRRSKRNLGAVIQTLLLSKARKIYTDRLKTYQFLIPRKIHRRQCYKINHIERKNLDLRTHLKRLGRKTICFSKSDAMLEACLKIYFWGGDWNFRPTGYGHG
jgi:insertion element IS1 protein InsB